LVRRLTSHLRANQQGLVFLAGLRSAPRIDDSAVDRLTSTSEGLNRTAQEQLQGLVGLNPFREYIEGKLKGIARLQQQGESSAQLCGDLQRVIPPPSPSWTRKQWLHLALTGNPGTGKTTVAKLLGEIYCEAGILPLGHTVKTSRDGLVDRYLGGTALKVRAAVQRALGGILFIDEAYSLCRGDNDEYGQEAVNTLVDAMSDLNGQFAVVLAGYPTDMDRFLAVNTGLRSRIDKVLILEDYQPAELEQILRQSLARHPGLRLDDELNASLTRLCFALHATRPADFGNARTMEQLASDIHENVAREDGEQAGLRHLPANYRQLLDQPAVGPEGILSELDALVGLRAVKESMRTLFNRLRLEQCRGQAGSRVVSGHMIFEGNPGTGKTTVARLLARQLQALGVLASGAVHPTTASQLIQGYVGQTTVATREFLEGGLGKVIFIDEAHQLAGEPGSHDFGRDALKVLVPFAEDHRQDCVIVLAGYPAPLRRLLDQDPGLASRFPTRLVFEDYSPEEMVEIFDRLLRGQQMSWPAEAGRPRLAEYFRRIRDAQGADFGNARSVRQEVEACLNRLANRLQREGLLNEVAGDLEAVRQLTLMDLPPQ
jgi:SpoVK/Ycf46/Vps4 family AAA+-type ATPase